MTLPLDVRTRLVATIDAVDAASKNLANFPSDKVGPAGSPPPAIDGNAILRRRAALRLLERAVDLEEIITVAAATLPADVAVVIHALTKLAWAHAAVAFAFAGVTIARVQPQLDDVAVPA